MQRKNGKCALNFYSAVDEATVNNEKLSFLCIESRFVGGQSSNIENIIKTLQYLFDDERFDLVASDFAAGLVLLQQEDLYEERSIDIYESVPLQLLKDGLYYNSYAQSAFGW